MRWLALGVLALTVLAIGASRVYLGVHRPSDVIAGFLFGVLYLSVLIAVRKALASRWQSTVDKLAGDGE